MADRWGRRSAMLSINISSLMGWSILAMAYYAEERQYVMLLLGRLLTGFSTGLASSPPAIYMAEVSSSSLRGVFTTWGSIFFSFGILSVYTLGLIFKGNWGAISLITACVPCVGILFTAFLVPESPTWLVGKNRVQEARTNMNVIFGSTAHVQVQKELEALVTMKGVKLDATRKPVLRQFQRKVKYLLKPHCLKPFGLVLAYFFFQQFSGTFAIVFYAIDIVKNAGITLDPHLTIVMVGLVRLFTALLLGYLSKVFGRRPLSTVSGIGMTACMLLLGGYISLINRDKISPNLLPLALLLLYFLTSTLGFLPMPFALAAEVFPTKIRGTAAGLLTGCGYIFNFIVVKIYPNMHDVLKTEGVFFFYGGVALLGTFFVVCFLPETKGKSLQEIQEYFGARKEKHSPTV